jgi:hypothetical protein
LVVEVVVRIILDLEIMAALVVEVVVPVVLQLQVKEIMEVLVSMDAVAAEVPEVQEHP